LILGVGRSGIQASTADDGSLAAKLLDVRLKFCRQLLT